MKLLRVAAAAATIAVAGTIYAAFRRGRQAI